MHFAQKKHYFLSEKAWFLPPKSIIFYLKKLLLILRRVSIQIFRRLLFFFLNSFANKMRLFFIFVCKYFYNCTIGKHHMVLRLL